MTEGTSQLDLSQYGISDVQEIYHNLSYEELYKHETDPSLEGFERGHLTSTEAVAVDTGIFTGRSPHDKYIIKESENEKNIWWKNPQRKSSDNKPLSEKVWKELYDNSTKQLSGKRLPP
jgi:phosphoenolpyruvate carboxykinase (ATP)